MNSPKQKRYVLLLLATLLLPYCVNAASYKLQGAQEREVQRQRSENAKAQKEAEELEAEYMKLSNESYKEKDMARAIEYCEMALAVTYEKWDIRETSVAGTTSFIPARSKVAAKLDTSNTRRAKDRLRALKDVIDDERKKGEDQFFKDAFERAETATLVQDHAKAFANYEEVIVVAGRLGQQKHAVQAKLKAQDKQKEILDLVTKPLNEAQQLIVESKFADAVAKIKLFEISYQPFLRLSPQVRLLYQKLSSSPEVKKAEREEDAQKQIQLGDAALLREDYVSAARYYREAITRFSDTDNAQEAAKKLMDMQSDPKIIEAMKLQEIDVKARPIIMHAETMLRLRNYEDARQDCQSILDEYPESTWAKRAQEILNQLPPQE